ncbi:Unknown protein [Striga hermonthica]|uniref:Uncharacterized protein n=1 Tax=Striga hermonthica TaxID=68872 RepID=A0A9N7RQE0_STRHE|nr:Unknown protein [Striga hermonthica]
MRVGVDRVREARQQKLRKDFESIAFKSGKGAEDFALRLSSIVSELQGLGNGITKLKAMQKYLCVVPARYAQMACYIETLLDLEDMSIEELSGRLAAYDGRGEPEVEVGGRLLLTHEEWRACSSTRGSGEGLVVGGGKPRDKGKKPQGRPRDGGGNKSNGGGKPLRRNSKCNYCGIEGHWARECRKAKRERGDQCKREEAHMSQGHEEESAALLMAIGSDVIPDVRVAPRSSTASTPGSQAVQDDSTGVQHVFLNEEQGVPTATTDGHWFLDTGASNHMTEKIAAFTEIDEKIKGMGKFGDGSMVEIQRRGSVLFAWKNSEHKVLTEDYHIPRLKTSIISLGQLAEVGFKTVIKEDEIFLYDRRHVLLANVKRMRNMLYSVILTPTKPVFRQSIGTSRCALGKQHRALFSHTIAYRGKECLELTHGDLYGPITPTTLAVNRYFLLIVDDASRYMWVEMLKSKDEALRFFKKIKAVAENESGLIIKAFRNDCGSEFISAEFAEFCSEHGLRRHTTAPYSP